MGDSSMFQGILFASLFTVLGAFGLFAESHASEKAQAAIVYDCKVTVLDKKDSESFKATEFITVTVNKGTPLQWINHSRRDVQFGLELRSADRIQIMATRKDENATLIANTVVTV